MNPEITKQIYALIHENTVDSLSTARTLISQNLDSLEEQEQERWVHTATALQTDIWEMIGFELKDEDFEALGIKSIDPNDYPLKEDE